MRFFLLAVCLAIPAFAQQCSFSLSPPSANFTASGGTGIISITATNNACERTATSSADWITIPVGPVGTGNGTVGYTVQSNLTALQRTGTITVAGQIFTVTQAAANCTFGLTPPSTSIPASGSSGSFEVNSQCAWTPSTASPWINVSATGASGIGRVNWTASANTGTALRTGTISIGTSSFTITQPGQCVFTLSVSQVSFPGQGGSGTITVTSSNDACSRPASSSVGWITLLSGQTGTGDGSIQFTVASNSSGAPRNGSIQVGSQAVVIGQFGSTCQFTLTPPQAAVAVSGGVGSFGVATTCEWTPTTAQGWIQITSNRGSTTGPGTVSFAITTNTEPQPRSGGIQIGPASFLVSQPAATCDISIQPQDRSVAVEGGPNSVDVYTSPSCNWSAASTVDWIVLATPTSGTGDGSVNFQVKANTAARVRTGDVTIGNKVLRVTQAAAACNVSLNTRAMTIAAAGGNGTINVTSNCDWSASTSAGWIRLTNPTSGSGNGSVSFTASPNSTTESRTATIAISGQAVTITQPAAGCSGLTLSATAMNIPARGGTSSFQVTGSTSCEWSASTGEPWLQVTWASVSGSGRVTASAAANTSGAERSAVINISGQAFRVVQPPVLVQLSGDAVVNGASFGTGAIAPGLIVTIFGTGFGPAALSTYQLTPDRAEFTRILADTRVLFDGNAAPVIYASAGQLSAVVPYAVAGKSTTDVQVEYLGVKSNTITVPVQPVSPAIFTLNASGRDQAAVLNQDYTLNGPSAPARRASIIQIFATGEGVTVPGGSDGKLAVAPLPRPVAPVRVMIGGIEAEVQYAGAAPGLLAGLVQINARVPNEVTPSAATPLILQIGGKESPAGVTIAVQ